MARRFTHEDVATVPRGWKVRTVTRGSHRVRIAFPPGARQTGAGRLIAVLHPRGETQNPCRIRYLMNPAELLIMGANPSRPRRPNPHTLGREISKMKDRGASGAEVGRMLSRATNPNPHRRGRRGTRRNAGPMWGIYMRRGRGAFRRAQGVQRSPESAAAEVRRLEGLGYAAFARGPVTSLSELPSREFYPPENMPEPIRRVMERNPKRGIKGLRKDAERMREISAQLYVISGKLAGPWTLEPAERTRLEAENKKLREEMSTLLEGRGLNIGRNPRHRGRRGTQRNQGRLVDSIRPGDRVTIVTRFGQRRTGKAVMRSPGGGWTLNMGGAHGTPALADDSNVTRVTHTKDVHGGNPRRGPAKGRNPRHRGTEAQRKARETVEIWLRGMHQGGHTASKSDIAEVYRTALRHYSTQPNPLPPDLTGIRYRAVAGPHEGKMLKIIGGNRKTDSWDVQTPTGVVTVAGWSLAGASPEVLRRKKKASASSAVRNPGGADMLFQVKPLTKDAFYKRYYYHLSTQSFATRAEAERAASEDWDMPAGSYKVVSRRRNPGTEEAAGLYQQFHGRAPKEILELQEPEARGVTLTSLGDLIELQVVPLEGRQWVQLDLSGDRVKLASNAKGTQLYFIGGNQTLTGEVLRTFGSDTSKELVELGQAATVVYRAKKSITDFKSTNWEHSFGEESGMRPILAYDARTRRLLLVGGEYKIEAPGIIN